MRLKDKVAIVTGAGTGIGEATALKFHREGAAVLLVGLPSDPVQSVADVITGEGGRAAVYLGDIADEHHAQEAVQTAVRAFGKVDILANIAGVLVELAEVDEHSVDNFDYTLRNNLRTAFLMTKYTLPLLKITRGNIVYAGSEAGFNGTPKFTPYGGTKGFIHAFMKGVAGEQAKYGVRANCFCPGAIASAWTIQGEGIMDKQTVKTMLGATPMGRRGTTEEMANVVAFLVSDEASYVTGALWLADGGITPAHGMPGDEVPDALKQEPPFTLPIHHAQDGDRDKPLMMKH